MTRIVIALIAILLFVEIASSQEYPRPYGLDFKVDSILQRNNQDSLWQWIDNNAYFQHDQNLVIQPYSGNVGVGTANPTTKMHLDNGSLKITDTIVIGNYAGQESLFEHDPERSNTLIGINNNIDGTISFTYGAKNIAEGQFAFAFGHGNTAFEDYAFALGHDNEVDARKSFIGGGTNNSINDDTASFIGGGKRNEVSGPGSFIGGGNVNQARGQSSFIGGSRNSIADGLQTFIAGGRNNEVENGVKNTTIGGGRGNTINGNESFIGGGVGNTINDNKSFIAGGNNNKANGEASFIGGGVNIKAKSYAEAVFGTYPTDYTPIDSTRFEPQDRVFNIGNGTSSGSRSDAFTVLKSGNTGIGTASPVEALDVQGNASLNDSILKQYRYDTYTATTADTIPAVSGLLVFIKNGVTDNMTVTIPLEALKEGYHVQFVDADNAGGGSKSVIATEGNEQLNVFGSESTDTLNNGDAVKYVSDGSKFLPLSHNPKN